MSLEKTSAKRRSWAERKRARPDGDERRSATLEAKTAFELAEKVRHTRERMGLTQSELAFRIGSTQPAVTRLEAGGILPGIDMLQRIAAALGLELVVELRRRRVAA